jgi:hypothetical protein
MICDYHLKRAKEIREKGAGIRDPRERELYEEFAQLHEARAVCAARTAELAVDAP